MDIHKNSISIAIADQGRNGEVRFYGRIVNNMDQLDKIIHKLPKALNLDACMRPDLVDTISTAI